MLYNINKPINAIIFICLMVLMSGCNTKNNKKISINKLIYCEIISKEYEEKDKYGITYNSALVPDKIYKIEGNEILLYKQGDEEGMDSSFRGFLDGLIIEKINNELEKIDYRNKNEWDFIDSVKYKEEPGCSFSPRFPPFIYLEFENRVKYYWKYNLLFFKKEYINFINMLTDIDKKVKLTYLKDTLVLKSEKQKITKFYSDSIKFISTIKFTYPKIKTRKDSL